MPLHRLTTITIGVPDIEATSAFYRDFGLAETAPACFATRDGGEQLRLVPARRRGLVELGVGADDSDDLDRIAKNLGRLGITVERHGAMLRSVEPATGVAVEVSVADRIAEPALQRATANGPGHRDRRNERAPAITRTAPVRPRKLGHVVLGTTDGPRSQRFFVDGIGFKVSDVVADSGGAFLRCSSDHHNLLVQHAPLAFLHHTAWEVEDFDEVGRGAHGMLAADPARHVWGPGRHYLGSNNFWYLRDPAGNFAEYYSDLDFIADDALWTPGSWSGLQALMAWGPPPSASFLAPEDLVARMME